MSLYGKEILQRTPIIAGEIGTMATPILLIDDTCGTCALSMRTHKGVFCSPPFTLSSSRQIGHDVFTKPFLRPYDARR